MDVGTNDIFEMFGPSCALDRPVSYNPVQSLRHNMPEFFRENEIRDKITIHGTSNFSGFDLPQMKPDQF